VTVRVIQGDCRHALRDLPDESVHCVCTSPPYWRQRDYGNPAQIGLEQTPDEYIDHLVSVFSAFPSCSPSRSGTEGGFGGSAMSGPNPTACRKAL
jgi:hypothetical protein